MVIVDGAGEGGRASLLDRLIAKADLMTSGLPVWPTTLAIPVAFLLPPLVLVVGEKWFAGVALAISLLPIVWLALWCARAMHGWSHPYASARWLHAVRGVVGDEAMTGLLVDLDLQHAREPDHVLTRREVIDSVAVQRRRAREAAARARGVSLRGTGAAS
ncbi:hypothetical protein [Sphingomonas lenta]|uniref:Uncharacterized protein n=1 Tax=Sphingomonas lenta TaxID=1141887 RepID=A0A2A2SBI3_9SPHN|nr:hypothetical protein [Sphingomonas lenta]PAX06381.1 hypothetical protein CKY28_17415 [Sphingomonas lenta]